jgi:hypothetical protein
LIEAKWEHLHKRSLAGSTEGAVETEAALKHPKKKPGVQQNSDLNDLGARHDLKEIQGTEGKVKNFWKSTAPSKNGVNSPAAQKPLWSST